MSKMPPCPRCRSNKHVVEHGDRDHYCANATCKFVFNHDPENDKEFFVGDPTRRIEKQDERRAQRYGTRNARPNRR